MIDYWTSTVTWVNPTPRVGVIRLTVSAVLLVSCVEMEVSACHCGRTTGVSAHLRQTDRTVAKVCSNH